jgi:hypothetical protein
LGIIKISGYLFGNWIKKKSNYILRIFLVSLLRIVSFIQSNTKDLLRLLSKDTKDLLRLLSKDTKDFLIILIKKSKDLPGILGLIKEFSY